MGNFESDEDNGEDEGESEGSGGETENSMFLTEAEPEPMSTKDLVVATLLGIKEEFPQDFQ